MRYKDEFQRSDTVKILAEKIDSLNPGRIIAIMEVCGTHTHAVARYGIRWMLPSWVRLLSGPGCPVCVTANDYTDYALALARIPNTVITTFGDMFRVPGSFSSLAEAKSRGADIRIVYSAADALEIAGNNRDKKIIFLGVGFETTIPTVAVPLMRAKEDKISNFFVLPGFKTLPNTLDVLASSPDLRIDGFLAPGHLSVITGTGIYLHIAEKYGISSVVTGFEPTDILMGIYRLLKQVLENRPGVVNDYSRVVRDEGNPKARMLTDRVFEPGDSNWRGIGVIPLSGMKIREEYKEHDASVFFNVEVPAPRYAPGCICGSILKGTKTPDQCPLFGGECTPLNPVGACMVSSEGTCAAFYKYQIH